MMTTVRVGRREVKLTNRDKVFFPELGLTKGDLIGYYLDVAPSVLNHVRRRPMQMKRYPDATRTASRASSTRRGYRSRIPTGSRPCTSAFRPDGRPTSPSVTRQLRLPGSSTSAASTAIP
jgi:DNA primase